MPRGHYLLAPGRRPNTVIGGGGTVTFRAIGTLSGGGGISPAPTKPAGTAIGDLLLIIAHSNTNGPMVSTGFLTAGASTYTGTPGPITRGHNFLWRIADGSEGASFSVTGGGALYNEAVCLGYSGATGVLVAGSTDTNFNSPALPVLRNNSMEVLAGDFDNASSNSAAPAGWTRRLNGNGTFNFWVGERAANAGITASSNFTGIGDVTNGYGLMSIILNS